MKAIVQTGYGSSDVFQLREIEMPVIDDDGVLVRVQAASVNALDWHLMRGIPAIIRLTTGLRRPKSPVPGVDVAGIVPPVRRDVTPLLPRREGVGVRTRARSACVAGHKREILPEPAGRATWQA